MPVLFPCPACKRPSRASRKLRGTRWTCKECGVETLVPSGPDLEESLSGEPPLPTKLSTGVPAPAQPPPAPAPPPPAPAAPVAPASPSLDSLALELERARLELERAAFEHAKAATARAPSAAASPAAAASPGQGDDDQVECPACAELIKSRAKVCKHCGHDVQGKPAKKSRGGLRGLIRRVRKSGARGALGARPRSRAAKEREASDESGEESSEEAAAPRVGRTPTKGTRRHAPAAAPLKNPGTAAVLAFFVSGLGHIYAGRIAFGLVFMTAVPLGTFIAGSLAATAAMESILRGGNGGGGVALWVICALITFCVHIWQIYDAYSSCLPPAQSGAAPRGRPPAKTSRFRKK